MENGKIRMSTANHDLPGFIIEGVDYFPNKRTSGKIENKPCIHEYSHDRLI